MELVFDIEADGLLPTVTKIHCVSIFNTETQELHSFAPDRAEGVDAGLRMLAQATRLVGHNIVSYDLAAIRKLHPSWSWNGEIADTLVMSRVIWPAVSESDGVLVKLKTLPSKLVGSQSLAAWGYRLGEHKGSFDGPWDTYTPEMGTYCDQDVRVTALLYAKILAAKVPARCAALEHDTARLLQMMEQNGFPFDEAKAATLWGDLTAQQDVINRDIQVLFQPAWEPVGKPETSTRSARFWRAHAQGLDLRLNKKTQRMERGWYEYRHAASEFQPVELTEFNLASRQAIAKRLTRKGWVPKEHTDTGQIKVSEKILRALPYPEAAAIADHFTLSKVGGMLATGDKSWLVSSRNGRMHTGYNGSGTVTGRATHYSPNIAQTPSVALDKDENVIMGIKGGYGHECRTLFYAPDGCVLVGADMSGLELRALAHFLARYDDGFYAREVVDGDVHTINQKAFGLYKRSSAKRAIYALLYGAGALMMAEILYADAQEAGMPRPKGKPEVLGNKMKKRFYAALPALEKLQAAVSAAVKKGRIKGLDGRTLHIRSEHSALNLLLQSAGALLCKEWMVLADRELTARGFRHAVDGDFYFAAWIHDELQVICKENIADEVGAVLVQCCKQAGINFNFRCPLSGEYKIGKTWAETH